MSTDQELIREWLASHHVTRLEPIYRGVSGVRVNTPPIPETRSEALARLYREGNSIRVCGNLFGVSDETVKAAMALHGVPMRETRFTRARRAA